MRKVIAARMQESLANSAQLTITMKADITKLATLQKQLSSTAEERYGTKLTITHFVSRAAVLALQAHPVLNSFYQNERIITHPHVHLGMAVALENGLVVPVIRHAEKLSLIELAQSISENAKKHARDVWEAKNCKALLSLLQTLARLELSISHRY